MRRISPPSQIWTLAVGDILTLGIVTLLGFARHGEILSAGLRPLTTFLPYCLLWFLLAPFIGAFRIESALQYRQLWRVGAAGLAAAPFAAMLRALILQSPVQPIFVLVLGLTVTLGLLLWRVLFILVHSRMRPADG